VTRPAPRKTTVEECIQLKISTLVRPGVFRAPPGTLCNSIWKDSAQREIFWIYFYWVLAPAGRSFLHINERRNRAFNSFSGTPAQNVENVHGRLHFGFRRWFLCPGLKGGTRCDRRAGILYLPPGESRFACRKCHGLVHQSAQWHDKRIDALLRLPLSELQSVVKNGNIRHRLLVIRACSVALERLRKRAETRRIHTPSVAESHAPDIGNNSGNRLGTEHPGTP